MSTGVNADGLRTDDWEEALVTGGGGQGALVYGGPAALRVTLSHERLFLPVDPPLDPPDTGAALDRLRRLCLDGDYQRAADEVVELAVARDPGYARLREIDPFVGAATLTFTPSVASASASGDGWARQVEFATGLVTQGWPGLTQRVFASRVDDVVVVSLRGAVRGRLHLGPVAGAPPAPITLRSGTAPQAIWLRGSFPRRWPGAIGGYVTAVRLVADLAGWHQLAGGAGFDLDTDHVLLIIRTVVGTDLAPDAVLAALARLPADEETLASGHRMAHGELMARCRVSLPDAVGRVFDAGRYAIISATGELPPTLQGVWSGTFHPPWRSGFTLDGNLATAVAALGPTGTPELLLPVLELIDTHLDDFRANARRLYRAPGFLLPPHVSTHGRHNHFGPKWCLTFWTGGAAWAARLYYDYWRYTGDLTFLAERAYPFMVEAMSFYAQFAQDDGDRLRLVPSYSPENSPFGPDGPQATINATHEIAAIRELARNLQAAAAALDREPSPSWQELLDRLPPYRVGPDGSLAEWVWPGLPDHHGHRHASHLYGLWYEPDPLIMNDLVLREAAATSVRKRLAWWATAGDEMAFGLVGLGLAAAALGLAAEAYEALVRLLRYWRPSLVSTHNVDELFNTDICGGVPALVVAMLAAGADDRLDLLPALPAPWRQGRIEGVLLRGGLRLDRLAWSPGGVEATLRCATARPVTVTVGGERPMSVDQAVEPVQLRWDGR